MVRREKYNESKRLRRGDGWGQGHPPPFFVLPTIADVPLFVWKALAVQAGEEDDGESRKGGVKYDESFKRGAGCKARVTLGHSFFFLGMFCHPSPSAFVRSEVHVYVFSKGKEEMPRPSDVCVLLKMALYFIVFG